MTTLPLFELDDDRVPEKVQADGAKASRAGAIYGVHAYHTKVPPEAIEPHILKHTRVDDVVLDPFCGSGMTGVAARKLGRWAWLSDLSPAAVHIARNYTRPCDASRFSRSADRVRELCRAVHDELYALPCPSCGGSARLAYAVWSDVRTCQHCHSRIRVWDQRDRGLRTLTCQSCLKTSAKSDCPVVGEEKVLLSIHCGSCGRNETDPVSAGRRDLGGQEGPGDWYPTIPFDARREMWRRGHLDLGIHSVADFYSSRNLRALSRLWAAIGTEDDERIAEALRFTFTAIANRASRRYQWNAKRPTNVLGGTLYVSSLRYEFNVFDLWNRKVRAARRLFEITSHDPGRASVMLASATRLPLTDDSVGYCFTDPPFGANIVYSDCSLLWEAWLGRLMDTKEEAVITRHRDAVDGGKDVEAYAELMSSAFAEIARVLRTGAHATVVFQNTDPSVWLALESAIARSGLAIEDAGTLNKGQRSFKGIKGASEGERVAASDVVLTLRSDGIRQQIGGSGWDVVATAIHSAIDTSSSADDRSTGHLYAVAVAAALSHGMSSEAVTFGRVEEWLRATYRFSDGWVHREYPLVS